MYELPNGLVKRLGIGEIDQIRLSVGVFKLQRAGDTAALYRIQADIASTLMPYFADGDKKGLWELYNNIIKNAGPAELNPTK